MSVVANEDKENMAISSQIQKLNKRRMIGDYILGKTQGEGTFGKVKSAVHQITHEKVAIKILEKERIIEVADVERVAREIHILKLIRHKHVIQLYEIIETPKHIFLVMEYADGGELFDYIVQNQKLNEIEACKFFQELISGIEYLHKLQIVHRDLKPENLLLDFNKSIKIIDFGLSNTYKKSEQLKTACGSPCYAAPEMIAGQKYNGLMVDIWSSGVILYAALCGCLPFEDQNTSALYKKILNGEYSVPKFITSDGQDFLKAILTTDPKKRISVEEMKVHPWFNVYKREHKIPSGIIIGYNRIPIDEAIVLQLEEKGYSQDYTMKCLDANKHNNVTTAYFLLMKKHILNGGKTIADINCETFDESLLEPKKRPQKRNTYPIQKAPISGLINNTMLQLNKKVRSGSCQQDSKPSNISIPQVIQPEQQSYHHRGRSVPHVNEFHDERGVFNQTQQISTLKAKGQYHTLNPQIQSSLANDYTLQLQSYQSIAKDDNDDYNKSLNLSNYLPHKTDSMNRTINNTKPRSQKESLSPQQRKNSSIQQINRSKKSVSHTNNTSVNTNSNIRASATTKNSSVQSKRPSNNPKPKTGSNLSFDYGYFEERRRQSHKFTNDLLDMTNIQSKKNPGNILLDQYNDKFIQSQPQTTTANVGPKASYPTSTMSNQIWQQMKPQNKAREPRVVDTNMIIQKIQQMSKRRDSVGARKSDNNTKVNQSFTFDRRGYLI